MSDSAGMDQGETSNELYTLVRKLTDMADDIDHKRRCLEELALEVRRMDSGVRNKRAAMVPGSPAKVPVAASERSIPSMVLEILATAQAPMTSRDIALGIMKMQGLDPANVPVRNRIIHRVSETLWVQTQKRLVRKAGPARSPIQWELARV